MEEGFFVACFTYHDETVYIIFIPIFLIYAVSVEINKFKLKNIHQILFDFCLFLIPVAIIIASANFIRYGDVFETGYGTQASSFSLNYFVRDWLEYLASSQRGIFPFNPILLLALPGWFFLPKQNRMFFALIAAIIISWYVLMCFWKSLQGGYCWGNRLVPILPLILIPLCLFLYESDNPIAFLATCIPSSYSDHCCMYQNS